MGEDMADSSFSRLIALAGPYRRRLTAACTLAVLSTAFAIAPYLLVYLAIEAHRAGDASMTWFGAGAAAACLVLRPLLFGLSTGIAHAVSFDTLAALRNTLLAKLARLPLGYFTARQTGALKRLVNENVEILELFFSHQLPDLLSTLVAPLATLVLLAFVDWRLALAAAAIIPVAWLANALIMSGHGEKIGRYFQMQGRINATLVEYLQGIETLKTADGGKATLERFHRDVEAFNRFSDDWRKSWMAPWALFSVATGASLLFVVPVGLALIAAGSTGPSVLLFAVLASTGIGAPIIKLMLYTEIFLRVSKAEESVHTLLNEKEIGAGGQTGLAPAHFAISFQDAGYAENGRDILAGVTFDIAENSVTAIVGPSGAGKTALIRLLTRYADPTSGTVLIGGRNVRDYSLEAVLENIAIISQDVFLFEASVADNISVGRKGTSPEAIRAAAGMANAEAFIEALPQGYDTMIGGNGTRLSGGERQRISLARALLRDAPVLVMDEATSHVDPLTEALIQEAINKLAGRKTVIIVSHRLDSIAGCDRIVLMNDGRMAACGTHEELLATSSQHRAMWELQQRNLTWTLTGEEETGLPLAAEPRRKAPQPAMERVQ
jgi:ABC-type multidrug transport system fused ATPase/permease subunit